MGWLYVRGPTPQRRWNAILWVREFVGPVICRLHSSARSKEFCVQPLEGLGRAIVGTEPEDEAPAMLDEATGA